LGFHVVLRLGDDRVIAASEAERRRWARRLAQCAEDHPIVVWKLADTHLHLVVLGDAAVVAELVRRLRIWVATALRPGVPVEVQRTKPLAGQSHLEAAFAYVLKQDDHHGVETDVYQDASAILDILGLRILTPSLPLRVREHLPRLTREALLKHLGVTTLEEAAHPEQLLEAAAAAFGLDVLAADNESTRARRAAVAAARDLGPAYLARLLGITPQAACRLAKATVPAREVRAVRLQMALRTARAPVNVFVREAPGAAYGSVGPVGRGGSVGPVGPVGQVGSA
jgi:hypothetical protein